MRDGILCSETDNMIQPDLHVNVGFEIHAGQSEECAQDSRGSAKQNAETATTSFNCAGKELETQSTERLKIGSRNTCSRCFSWNDMPK